MDQPENISINDIIHIETRYVSLTHHPELPGFRSRIERVSNTGVAEDERENGNREAREDRYSRCAVETISRALQVASAIGRPKRNTFANSTTLVLSAE